MSKVKNSTIIIVIAAFTLISVLLYVLLTTSDFQVMGLPVSIFLLWLYQLMVAILAWIFYRKLY